MGSLLDVAMQSGRDGFTRLRWPYSRTDIARNGLVEMFLAESQEDDDVLVMLDDDHLFPPDVVRRLVRHNVPVVGALAFRRGVPYFPCMFVRVEGGYGVVGQWDPGLHEVAMVGTGAIAIRRHVFTQLDDAGFPWPYFRYQYPAGDRVLPSEDIYFSQTCEKAGVQIYCDTTFCIPHLTSATVDEQSWQQWQEDHPEGTNWDEMMRPRAGAEAEREAAREASKNARTAR